MSGETSRAALETAVLNAMDVASVTSMRWGKDDCALWCANIVREALGYDAADTWRGRYRTRRGAMRVVGGNLLAALRKMARRHNWKRIAPELAQPGDVGMAWTTHDGRAVLATVICRARGWFVGRAENGVSMMRADRVAIAWSVLPDALPGGPGPRVRLDRATHEPVSIGTAILSLLSITASSTVAAVVGSLALTAVSRGVSVR